MYVDVGEGDAPAGVLRQIANHNVCMYIHTKIASHDLDVPRHSSGGENGRRWSQALSRIERMREREIKRECGCV